MTFSCGAVVAIRVPLAIASRWRDDVDRCTVGGIGWHRHATTATEQQRGADDKNDLTRNGVFHCSCLFLVSYLCPALTGLVIIHPSISRSSYFKQIGIILNGVLYGKD